MRCKVIIFLLVALMAGTALEASAQDNIEKMTDNPTGYIKAGYPYYYGSKDGVLYVFLGSDPVILVRYPANDPRESFTVPNTVSRIAKGAFRGARNLKELIVSPSVIYIGDNAFDDTEIESFKVLGNDISTVVPSFDDREDQGSRLYDLSGVRISSPSPGVTIMVGNDGTSKLMMK